MSRSPRCAISTRVFWIKRLGEVEKSGGKRPARYTDIRELLEKEKDIDAISIATPNHNHALQTIWALQAGKHVYCEKPQTHNIFEVEAGCSGGAEVRQDRAGRRKRPLARRSDGSREEDARRPDRRCLHGSRPVLQAPRYDRPRQPEPVPAGVHYDLWLGPAPKTEFTKNRFHYTWHWFWDYGNGDFGNQGIHELDIARWGLGVKYPTKVSAIGGHFMFDDDQQTPNTLNVAYEFNEGGKHKMMVFEVRHWDSNHEAGIGGADGGKNLNTVGNTFYGSNGYLAIDGYNKYESWLGKTVQTGPRADRSLEKGPSKTEGGSNWRNFIEVVKSGDRSKQNNDIEEGAISAVLMHLGNISYRLGRSLNFDAAKMQVVGDSEANKMFTRPYRAPFTVPAKV